MLVSRDTPRYLWHSNAGVHGIMGGYQNANGIATTTCLGRLGVAGFVISLTLISADREADGVRALLTKWDMLSRRAISFHTAFGFQCSHRLDAHKGQLIPAYLRHALLLKSNAELP